MLERFELRGNRPYIRTEEELLTIDKDIADEAFKKNKKIILDKTNLHFHRTSDV